MGSLIGFFVTKGLSDKAARAVSYALLFLLVAGTLGGLVAAYNHHIIGAHEARQIKRALPAINKAADERATDTITKAKHEQELHDVISAQPDQPIAPTSRALACKRLRDAGRTSPACR